jgi:hypothetical protein
MDGWMDGHGGILHKIFAQIIFMKLTSVGILTLGIQGLSTRLKL